MILSRLERKKIRERVILGKKASWRERVMSFEGIAIWLVQVNLNAIAVED